MMKMIKYIPLLLIICLIMLWIGSVIRCEILTSRHSAEFIIPDEVVEWAGDSGTMKVISLSEQSAKIYYYYLNDYFAVLIYFTKHNNIWQYETWKAVWTSGSADDFIWPYFHHSPVGKALFVFFSIPLLLITIILWKYNEGKYEDPN